MEAARSAVTALGTKTFDANQLIATALLALGIVGPMEARRAAVTTVGTKTFDANHLIATTLLALGMDFATTAMLVAVTFVANFNQGRPASTIVHLTLRTSMTTWKAARAAIHTKSILADFTIIHEATPC